MDFVIAVVSLRAWKPVAKIVRISFVYVWALAHPLIGTLESLAPVPTRLPLLGCLAAHRRWIVRPIRLRRCLVVTVLKICLER